MHTEITQQERALILKAELMQKFTEFCICDNTQKHLERITSLIEDLRAEAAYWQAEISQSLDQTN